MKRILFVDDETSVLDGLRRTLHEERERWEMKFVSSGEDALAAFEENSFDVVVSDLRMPGMDGVELLGKVRDLYPRAARILVSGNSEFTLSPRAISVAYRVLVKPCNGWDLKQTIERVCLLQDCLGQPGIQAAIGAVGELPVLSQTYIDLTKALNDPDSSIRSITKIVEQDGAMCAKILQIVNSGFFGLSLQAIGLEHAVSYLGMDTVRTLALHSETFRVFVPDRRIPCCFLKETQADARRVAIVVGTLPLTRRAREVALVAALMHDVGTLLLASAMPKEFLSILEEMESEKLSRTAAEEKLLGTSHAEIGAYLLGLWGINSAVVEAIAHHHHAERIRQSELDSTAALFVANLMAEHLEAHADDEEGGLLDRDGREGLERLGLLTQFPEMRRRAVEALAEMR